MKEITIDERRKLFVPGNAQQTIQYCVNQWIDLAKRAIADHGFFAVALSGGSTPKAIYKGLVEANTTLDWEKVYLFWSDERSVAPDDPESNFHMALEEGGLNQLPILAPHIFRMVAEKEIEQNARNYEELIVKVLEGRPFDLIMLGMGEDGHTASLFPHTKALHEIKRLVVANHVPQKTTWRMTFTFPCINAASTICLYALGSSKANMLHRVLKGPFQPDELPSQNIGTHAHPALWIADESATSAFHKV